MHASHCMRGSEAKEGTCKLWWAYAFQFVKLLRRERPATGKDPRGARSTQYWGRMEERTAHMKRYMRIAKRYMLEQRMQRLLNSGASGAAAPHPVSSFTDSDASPSALPFALTSPPSSLLSLSSPFLGCVSSSLSSTAASSSGLPYTTSEENLADFFSHFWTKRQAQLRRQETRGPERGSSQGPPDVTRSLFQGDSACGVLRMGARPAQAPFALGDEDSDASFIVGIVERRPYWAVAQWHMLAAAELEAAEKALLKTRSAASQKDDQKTVARLLASLDQEQRRLIHTQQKRLLASHMPTDDVSSVSVRKKRNGERERGKGVELEEWRRGDNEGRREFKKQGTREVQGGGRTGERERGNQLEEERRQRTRRISRRGEEKEGDWVQGRI
uniref:Uncharacterized protein n=1 Tax=Toxoplasma gondii TgCATBr9 TaxID=943120 RepID=A0A2T6IGW7_TOXGO|nr:hypothetical protein TGBR9_211150B [Toxoplasma gondii TgCATBr9]